MSKSKDNNRLKTISLYPLRPTQALSAFMKVKPKAKKTTKRKAQNKSAFLSG